MKSIQDAIESLHAKELCPRLHVDVTHTDAVCPDFVREKWQQRLVIDLDPSYPLDLGFTKVGVEADLSFGGYVTRCVFPWDAIYVVADRATGRGQVFASNIPASLRHEFGAPTPASKAASIDPELTKVRDDDAKPGSRRRKRRGAAEPSAPVGLRPVADLDEDDEDEREDEQDAAETGEAAGETQAEAEAAAKNEADTPASTTSETPSAEETARARRSAFKVLDGGS
jgi:stringent starvation protein B